MQIDIPGTLLSNTTSTNVTPEKTAKKDPTALVTVVGVIESGRRKYKAAMYKSG